MTIYRVHVRESQLRECVTKGLFAIPRTPRLFRGDLLLLQLTKRDFELRGRHHDRIEHALVFDQAVMDTTGAISHHHWPAGDQRWPWIIYANAVIDTVPFSLEELPLRNGERYRSRANPVQIGEEDALEIEGKISWNSARPIFTAESDPARAIPVEADPVLGSALARHALCEVRKAARRWDPGTRIVELSEGSTPSGLLLRRGHIVERVIRFTGTSERPTALKFEGMVNDPRPGDPHHIVAVVHSINLTSGASQLTWAPYRRSLSTHLSKAR